jgi:hypothetical protein
VTIIQLLADASHALLFPYIQFSRYNLAIYNNSHFKKNYY